MLESVIPVKRNNFYNNFSYIAFTNLVILLQIIKVYALIHAKWILCRERKIMFQFRSFYHSLPNLISIGCSQVNIRFI